MFLKALVEEIAPLAVGRRIRAASLDRDARLLTLFLGPPGLDRLIWSYLSEAPGAHVREGSKPPKGVTATPGIQKLLAGAVIEEIAIADRDRILSLACEGTRLSGRTTAARLVLEIVATRADLYLVEEPSSTIVDAWSSARPRLPAGERYQPPPPLPRAAPLAANAAELEERLASGADLLEASGATPLLVREMRWLMERRGLSASAAFAEVRKQLEAKRPFFCGRHGKPPLLAPIELQSDEGCSERASFSEAMAEAVALAVAERALREKRTKLERAVAKRLDRLRRLEEKLTRDVAALEEPSDLRARGERLLAGLSRARRSKDGHSVALPDPFDPEEKLIELAIDPKLSLAANAERFFARARKAERGKVETAKRLERTRDEIDRWEELARGLSDAGTLEEIEELEEEAVEAGLAPASPQERRKPKAERTRLGPRSFRTEGGREILVGRSGRSNDELTFGLARSTDLWLHASGMAGAHVVLRDSPGSPPDEAEIRQAAELAAYFSKGRESGAVDVMVTERRNVSRIPGAPPGRVRVKSARTVRAAPRRPGNR